jgi:hypothetical protein
MTTERKTLKALEEATVSGENERRQIDPKEKVLRHLREKLGSLV